MLTTETTGLENIARTASRMYGISSLKSRLIIEKILNTYKNLSEGEILRRVGEESIFYIGALKQ
ncbi:MAG TPA: hypothetical protein DHW82_01130 [Spirochaetia bacterium]|nr:MAG: hypothetical protein A2Y41_02690 [Spirochaetes bacterium GWB1_36_13]HCL55599.1 hypothetical protein [Spirochaetia bacterium]